MATRKKSKMTGLLMLAGAVFAGAWWNDIILEQLHKFGFAKDRN